MAVSAARYAARAHIWPSFEKFDSRQEYGSLTKIDTLSDSAKCDFYKEHKVVQCPHCSVHFSSNPRIDSLGRDSDGFWVLELENCPECGRIIATLVGGKASHFVGGGFAGFDEERVRRLVRPKSISRGTVPKEVTREIAQDYEEACLVLGDSPKASAALSRRCLQNILREKANVTEGSLKSEIDQTLQSGQLPSYIADGLDAVRNIGNFAAHPMKSQNTGAVVEVEDGEAEWNLNIIETLFDFYFVQPAKLQQKKAQLNKKLKDSGRKPMT